MTYSQSISKQVTFGRRFAAAAAVAIVVALPATGQAGLFDKAKQGVEKVAGAVTKPGKRPAAPVNPIEQVKNDVRKTVEKVTEIGNGVARVQGQLHQLVGNLHGEGVEQLKEAVTSTLQYLQHAQADYADFVAPDNCGNSSDCGAFREDLRGMIQNFAALPGDLPFVERVPAAVGQLQKFAELVDFLPPPVLYAADQAIGAQIDEVQEMVEILKAVADELPEIPTIKQIAEMNEQTAKLYCDTVIDNPQIELVKVILLNQANRLADLADMLPDTLDVVAATFGTNVKHPPKMVMQLIAFIPKELDRQLSFRTALVESQCDIVKKLSEG